MAVADVILVQPARQKRLNPFAEVFSTLAARVTGFDPFHANTHVHDRIHAVS